VFVVATSLATVELGAQNLEDDLKVYAVGVINVAPFKMPFSGYGVYLGQNAIITAAHVVGHWPLFTNPMVMIAGEEIPAKVIKKGTFPQLDLALLTVSDTALPVNLRMRRMPLCKEPAKIGTDAIVVYSDRIVHSQIISAQIIPAHYRRQFGSLIGEPEGSGSGVYDASKRCLVGIMSAAVTTQSNVMNPPKPRYDFGRENARVGYFVPASTIAEFLPDHLRF
jgi:hypothetical protein